MNATEELRRLLRERGVECHQRRYGVGWTDSNGYLVSAEQWGDALLVHAALTPEQAVDATVGRETCRNADARAEAGGVWHSPRFVCSKCGAAYAMSDYARFCPSCGRRVVE